MLFTLAPSHNGWPENVAKESNRVISVDVVLPFQGESLFPLISWRLILGQIHNHFVRESHENDEQEDLEGGDFRIFAKQTLLQPSP